MNLEEPVGADSDRDGARDRDRARADLVVANWSGGESDKKTVDVSTGHVAPRVATSPAASTAAGVPTQLAIDTCNQSAAAQAGQREKAKDTAIAGAIGAVAGAAVGAAGGAVIDGGSGGGTLYGLNENGKHDERYRNAYAACMPSRGYTG